MNGLNLPRRTCNYLSSQLGVLGYNGTTTPITLGDDGTNFGKTNPGTRMKALCPTHREGMSALRSDNVKQKTTLHGKDRTHDQSGRSNHISSPPANKTYSSESAAFSASMYMSISSRHGCLQANSHCKAAYDSTCNLYGTTQW